jgi:hypothetical protein
MQSKLSNKEQTKPSNKRTNETAPREHHMKFEHMMWTAANYFSNLDMSNINNKEQIKLSNKADAKQTQSQRTN